MFKEKLQNKQLLEKITSKLKAKSELRNHKLSDYEFILAKNDKNLFIQFKEGKITFDQFFTRVVENLEKWSLQTNSLNAKAEISANKITVLEVQVTNIKNIKQKTITLIVLDDLIEKSPQFLSESIDKNDKFVKLLFENREPGKTLESWENDRRCRRSIMYHHKKVNKPGLVSRKIKDRSTVVKQDSATDDKGLGIYKQQKDNEFKIKSIYAQQKKFQWQLSKSIAEQNNDVEDIQNFNIKDLIEKFKSPNQGAQSKKNVAFSKMTSKERQVVQMKRLEQKIEEMICKETSNFNSNA